LKKLALKTDYLVRPLRIGLPNDRVNAVRKVEDAELEVCDEEEAGNEARGDHCSLAVRLVVAGCDAKKLNLVSIPAEELNFYIPPDVKA
jgi:hypothetical protein